MVVLLVGVEGRRFVCTPMGHIASEQAIFRQEQLVGAFPGTELEQLAIMPKVANRLPQHIRQKLHRDDVEQSDTPLFVATECFVDVKGGAAML